MRTSCRPSNGIVKTPRFGAGALDKFLSENTFTIGLLISNSADRRLLIDFLQHSGYQVRAGMPSPGLLDDWAKISLIITDERTARQYGKELLALKHQSGGFFMPLLIALPQNSEGAPWLHGGFDDVLRMPLKKQELAARLQVYLHLRAQSEESRRLASQVVLAQEAERKRLSRELHDEIGQALTAVSFNLQAYQQAVGDSTVEAQLQDSLSIIESTLHQVRDLALDLHPTILDDLGLVAALQWYIGRQAQRAGLIIELIADPTETSLPAELNTTCFRIVQEALTNILRHARAKKVVVELRRHRADLELVIRDDGIGFDVSAVRGASLGLLGMQERVVLLSGQIKIKSKPGSGTEIRARFPLAPPVNSPHHAQGKRRRK
jgi:signal transduction histidine kinase